MIVGEYYAYRHLKEREKSTKWRTIMGKNNVGWFEIYVDDMERAKAFYEAVIGVKLDKLESPGIEMWAFPMDMEAPGSAGSLVHMPGFPAGGNSTLVYFSCEDCATEE